MADNKDSPANTSGAYDRMASAWQTISDILAGPATIRAAGTRYLPKYEKEGQKEYERRLAQAPWRPEFEDILNTLSAKPFGKDVALGDKASDAIKAFAEDVDSKGANLTAFARPMFRAGVGKGMHAILVDHSGTGEARTMAEERQSGARPYWVSIRAEDILALYTAFVPAEGGAREVPVHVRLRECSVERDGFGETVVERVRILNREPIVGASGKVIGYGEPTWTLQKKTKGSDGEKWMEDGSGRFAPLTEIPLALFWTGEREGSHFVRAPLAALADMQIELFRTLSRKDEVLTYAGSPMLQAKGLAPPAEGEAELTIGPKTVLYAPSNSEGGDTGYEYIQPDAANLKEIREDAQQLIEDIRRLGMQPLARGSGTESATRAAIEGAKAHSVVEAWALGLKDVLEQAFVFTCRWLREEPTVEVEVDTDFSVEPFAQAPLDALAKARAAKDISQRTYWSSLRRFDVLAPDFDADAEEKALAEETQGLEPEEPIDPITGQPLSAAA